MRWLRWMLAALWLPLLGAGEPPTPQWTLPSGRLAFREYTKEDGLPNASIQDILQTPEGLMWFISEAGAIRYDGRRFRLFGPQDGLDSRLPRAGTLDSQGHLFVVGDVGLYRFKSERFQAIPAFNNRPLVYVAPWPGDRLLVAERNGDLFVGSPEKGFTPLDYPAPRVFSALCAGSDGTLWMARGRNILQRHLDGTWRTWGVDEGLAFGKGPGESDIRGILRGIVVDRQGVAWARSTHHLFRLARGAARWEDMSADLPPSTTVLLRPGEGDHLWVFTDQGLRVWSGGRWRTMGPREGLSPAPTVFFEDQEGSLWLRAGTLKRLQGRGAIEGFRETEGIPSGDIWALLLDRRGSFFVGTMFGVASTDAAGRWQQRTDLPKAVFNAFCEGKDGTIYALCSPTGLFAQFPGEARFRHLPLNPANLGSFHHAFQQDRSGTFWIGTEDAGLWTGDITRKGGIFKQVDPSPEHPTEYVGVIREDEEGRLWVASSRGLAIRDKGVWHRYSMTHGLPRTGLISLALGPEGRFWAVGFAANEVLHGRYAGGTLQIDPGAAHKVTDITFTVHRDPVGTLWIGTGAGVERLEPGHSEHFGVGEGLAGDDTIANRMLTDRQGGLWIATANGLNRIDPARWGKPLLPPRVHLASLRLGGQEAVGQEGLRVPFRQHVLEAQFSALSFLNEKAIHIRARLVGYEAEWQAADAGVLRYPQLPPGTYRLELQARREVGPWGEVRAYAFTVLPAWWQTLWFRGFMVMLGGLGVAGLVAWRTRSLRGRAEHLESLVQNRTEALGEALSELQEANESLRALSLTDPLTGLRNRRFLSETIEDDVAKGLRAYRDALAVGRVPEHQDLLFVLIDLDHFKRVNDTFGHPAGDQVLVQMRDRLVACVRETDTLVRWGGEEFLVVGRQLDGAEAPLVAERIRSAVHDGPFLLDDGQTLHLTCSIGWACFPFLTGRPEAIPWKRVMDLADQCLYAAKRSGRNAWIGLAPTETLDPSVLCEPPTPEHLRDLQAQGDLRILASQPPGTAVDWLGHGTTNARSL